MKAIANAILESVVAAEANRLSQSEAKKRATTGNLTRPAAAQSFWKEGLVTF